MPHAVPFTTDDTARLHDTLTALIDSGGSPGGVVMVGTTAGQREVLTAGIVAPECGDQAPDEHTVYDIASLTKVVATWPLVGQAVRDGLIGLDAPIRDFLPAFSGEAPSGEATVRQLLAHTSGLRASTRLDQYRNTGTPLHELMCKEPLGDQPGQHRYINRGFILLGLALAHINQLPLHDLARRHWAPIGMPATAYGPVSRGSQVAPTERILAGAPRIWGGPHDDNAALLGGVAGHAGVFSTPADLAALAVRLLHHYAADDSPVGQWLHDSFTPHAALEPGIDRGLAWILAAGGRVAYHHGFTGTSLYLNPEHGRYLVVCTNAIYHGPARKRLQPLRDLALKTTAAT
ncbi:serine hydrolase domain-containing protein [Streptacidiphilus melanogenes]|uniref:serine hydrolase domain-containing protein n=1 Tax=Streptacidiphilus melanogenes TaxID=411235 RepID=UPI0005AB0F2D|nr:serine hydrolase domain-containing protein [Streptacidiphilus melanogenes]